jgi:ankyrin repeat protein
MWKFLFLLGALISVTAQADHPGLARAAELDDIRSFRAIIESGEASVDEIVTAPPFATPRVPILNVAARAGSEKVAQYLIEKGARLNVTMPNGDTALMLAVFFDDSFGGGNGDFAAHDRIARLLVRGGADINFGEGYQALSYAAFKSRKTIGKFLMDEGAWVDGLLVDGISPANTPLMMAVIQGHKEFALMLLRAGANAGIINRKGNTALILAKKYNQTHITPYINCALNLKPGEDFQKTCE